MFYDSITLDDDPAAIERFTGIDMLLNVPRWGGVVYDDDREIPATLQCKNYSGREIVAQLSGDIVDAEGHVWAKLPPRSLKLPAGDYVAEFAVGYPVPERKGRLYLRASATENGKAIGRTRRAVGLTANPSAIGQYDGPFGIQGIHSFRSSCMKNVGARCYNLWLNWPRSESEKGKIVWDTRLEKVLSDAVADPTALVMMTFREIPKWYQAGGEWNHCVPKDDQVLEDFARKAAAYYREKHNVNHWSYWEEPSGYLPWPRYLQLFKAAVRGYRAGNPQAKIVGLCAVSTEYPFVEWMFKNGAGQHMDIFGHHVYINGRPEDYGLVGKLNMVKGFMRKYNNGEVLPMWDTECGMYVAGLATGLVPLNRAQVEAYKEKGWYRRYYFADSDVANFTVRKMVLGYANGLTKYFFHKSLRSFDYTYTLTALAVSTLSHQLAGATFVKQLELPSKSTHGYVFARDGKCFCVLWTTRGSADTTLKLARPDFVLMDRFGNKERTVAGDGNLVHLTLSETPVYLFGIGPGIDRPPDGLSLECPENVTAPSFEMTIQALAGMQLKGRLSVWPPKGWTVKPRQLDWDSASVGTAKFEVTVPWGVLRGDHTITAILSDTSGRPLYSAQGEVALAIAVPCRRLGEPIKLDGDLGDWPTRIRALEVRSLDQVVMGRPAVEDTYTLSQQVARGSRFWKGVDDLSATVRTAWDDTHFYVGIDVRDKTLLNDFMKNPYQGDSIEMFLDTRRAGEGLGTAVYADGVHHLRFVPPVGGRKEGRQVGYFTRTADAKLRRRPEFIIRSGEMVYSDGEAHLKNRPVPAYAADNRFAYRVTDNGYAVEFTIPFTTFLNGRPEVGETFGFDLMFNDQDYPKEVRAVTLCWYGNGKNSTNPSVFGKLRLVSDTKQ